MKEKTKVIAYIFRDKNVGPATREVLVFLHRDYPEAGIQVVGGTVEDSEDFKEALSREILEEAGVSILPQELTKIGETIYLRKDREERNFRHYFSVIRQDLPEQWSHTVKSHGEDDGMVFNFYWLSIPEAKSVLTGNFGELL